MTSQNFITIFYINFVCFVLCGLCNGASINTPSSAEDIEEIEQDITEIQTENPLQIQKDAAMTVKLGEALLEAEATSTLDKWWKKCTYGVIGIRCKVVKAKRPTTAEFLRHLRNFIVIVPNNKDEVKEEPNARPLKISSGFMDRVHRSLAELSEKTTPATTNNKNIAMLNHLTRGL